MPSSCEKVTRSILKLLRREVVKLSLSVVFLSLSCNLESTFASTNSVPPTIPEESLEVIKFKIQDSHKTSEWIRTEINGSQVKLLHTRNSVSGFSKFTERIPMMSVPDFYVWYDHPVKKAVFVPDNCSITDADPSNNFSTCLVSTDGGTLLLPQGSNIYQGQFTIQYTENEILRTVTFRLPNVSDTIEQTTDQPTPNNYHDYDY